MQNLAPDDGNGVLSVCLVILFCGIGIWFLVSVLISWMSRRGEEQIRRMEKAEEKLSARLKG